MTRYKLTILGCGNSPGTPTICNNWGVCDPAEPRNRRLRASLAVQAEDTTLIIDTGPDFRYQINRTDIARIDAILYTHAHSDHVNGIDELRILRLQEKRLFPIYGNEETLATLRTRFAYLFDELEKGVYPKVLDPHVIPCEAYGAPMAIGAIRFTPYDQDHGTCRSLGYRFGDAAYTTDMLDLPPESIETLRGIKTWIVDGCAYHTQENRVHATLEKIYAFNETIGATRVIITHLSGQMDYRALCAELPRGYEPAYDGLVLEAFDS